MKILMIASADNPLIISAAEAAAGYFEESGISAQTVFLKEHVQGCTGCGRCWKNGTCVFEDGVNQAVSVLDDVQGLMVLTSVLYGEPAGQTMNFLDRLMHCAADRLAFKPAVSVLSSRGTAAAKAQARLNERFAYADMIIISHKNGFVLREENDILIPSARLAQLIRNTDGCEDSAEPVYSRELDYVR